MKFASRIMVSAAIFMAFHVGSATAAPSARNVLFIIADDLNTFLACYGDSRAKTPNIDRLAARGVRFDRAYCSQPLCGPSRNSILTGLYPNSTGILGNAKIFRQSIPTQISLPQAFRNQGWFVARVGKLYHYDVPMSIGTAGHDDPASWEVQINPAGVDHLEEENKIVSLSPGNFGATLSWYASPKADADHTDGKVASEAEWILERCAKQQDRPFFLAVGFFRPHTPFVAPRSPYFDEYAEADMPIVTGVKEDQYDIPQAALASRKAEEEKMTDTQRRQAMHGYYASISFMDAQVGRVIDALDRLKLTDSTIVVFTSDHGYHMGEHGLWQKRSLFEESTRVPLLIIAPGVTPQAAVAKSPMSQVDLYPTLAGLCGIKTPSNLQGQNLIKTLIDPSEVGRGWAVTRGTQGYSLRTERWRYTEWDEGKQGHELYDHNADPKELKNLANDPALEQIVKSLSEQLRSAVKTTFPPSGKTPEINEGLWTPRF